MTWNLLHELTLTTDWQYSPVIAATLGYVRLKHSTTGIYSRLLLAQAQTVSGEPVEFWDVRTTFAKSEYDLFEFVPPPFFAERRLAFKIVRASGMLAPWHLQIEVNTIPLLPIAGGGSVDYTAALGAIQAELSALTTAEAGLHDQLITLGLGQAAIATQQAGLAASQTATRADIDVLHTGLIGLATGQGAAAVALAALATSEQTSHAAVEASLSAIRAVLSLPTPTPTPTPAPTPPATAQNTPYTATQSSIYSIGSSGGAEVAVSYAMLTDGLTNQWATTSGSGNDWIKASFAQAVSVSSVQIGVGVSPSYVNYSAKLQYSTDDTNWIDILTLGGFSNDGVDRLKTFAFSTVNARYWRVWRDYTLSLSEFSFLP